MSFNFTVVAAPMAGISNRSYRDIVRSMGADLAYGEMVSARALIYGNKKTFELMDFEGERYPRLVQLFGADPVFIRDAAKIAASLGAEYLDLNMGCPVPKVVRNGEGSALMREPELAATLVRAAAEAGLPVSVKMRSGWNETEGNAVEFAKRMEGAGAAFLAVHGRTREQYYLGHSDWGVIGRVKQAVTVPVIGNGDIYHAADALRMREESGCDGVMVGRGMLGNPWIFADIKAVFAGKEPLGRPAAALIIDQALAHLREHIRRSQIWLVRREGQDCESVRLMGEKLAVQSMRNHLGWYLKGLHNSAQVRGQLNIQTRYKDIEAIFNKYLATEDGSKESKLEKTLT